MQSMNADEPITNHRRITFPEGLFLGALLVRCGWLIGMVKTPFWTTPLVDALTYHEMATRIAAGEWIPRAVFERTPLYPYIIAVVYAIAGSDLLWIRLLQAAVGAANVVLLYRLTARLFDEQTGRVTGILAASYGMFWIHEADILAPVWVIFFLLLAFLFALPPRHESNTKTVWIKWIKPAFSGLSLGLAGLTWPTALFAAPGLWHAVGRVGSAGGSTGNGEQVTGKKINWRSTIIAVVATMILPLATVVYQGVRFGEPMLSLQGGVNLYIGNNPSADGFSAIMPGFGPAWRFEELQQDLSRQRGHNVSWHELDKFYRDKALTFMVENPGKEARLLLQKFLCLTMPTEIPNTFDPYVLAMAYPWARAALWCGWWIILPLGLVGIVLRGNHPAVTPVEKSHRAVEQGIWIALVGLAIGVILFFVNMRYRLPLAPLVIPFAAVTLLTIWRRRKQWKQAAIPAMAVLMVWAILGVDWIGYGGDGGTYGMMQLALSFRNEKRYDEAERWFSEALAVNQTYPGIRNELARLAIRRGDFAAAKSYADGEVFASLNTPFRVDIATVLYNVGGVYAQLGELDSAAYCFRTALERNPSYEPAQRNLWRVQLQKGARDFLAGDSASAISEWEQVKKSASGTPLAISATNLLTQLRLGTLRPALKSMPSLDEIGFE